MGVDSLVDSGNESYGQLSGHVLLAGWGFFFYVRLKPDHGRAVWGARVLWAVPSVGSVANSPSAT